MCGGMNVSFQSGIRVMKSQHTIAREVTVEGVGLLLGQPARVTICPAAIDTGIVFERTDLDPPVVIPARVNNVIPRARRTTLRNGETTIETVEHCLSALSGMHIDNARIKLDGPELPCGDGSAKLFVDPIIETGVVEQDAAQAVWKLQKPIVLEEGESMIAALPSDDEGMRVIFDLDYGENNTRIQRQTLSFIPGNGNYVKEIAPARTYSLREEAQALWDRGMCRHLTPRDVLVIGEEGPIDNAYRFDNEPVRHKVLDVIGDLTLIGCAVQCRIIAYKSGHALNRSLAIAIRRQIEADRRIRIADEDPKIDARAIQRIMPHRYPMLLVDKVVEIEADRRAIGIKNVTMNEPFFQGHYPGTPIMPGVLLVEAMAQLGGLLLNQKLEHTGKIAVLMSLDRVKLRKPVVPGDQDVLEAVSLRARPRTGSVRCKAFVGDRLAAEAQIRFMMVDSQTD